MDDQATPLEQGPISSRQKRLFSLDIFRGLTIFTMVFVNDVAGVRGIPGWMKHAAADADAMTFVDVVFPAFLFIVGMAIPFAVRNRLRKGDSTGQIWKHVLIRTAGLLTLGFFMVNAGEMNREAMLIPGWLWNVLLYVAAVLIWNRYPRTDDRRQRQIFRGLRIMGVLILVALIPLFRKGDAGSLMGMTPSWWGILGLIGWAYLYAMIAYWLLQRRLYAMTGVLGLFTVMAVGLMSDGMAVPDWLQFASHAGNLTHASLVVGGIVLSTMLLREEPPSDVQKRLVRMLAFGAMLAVAAWFLRPLYGISKIYATPSWALYSAAICCGVFALVYWIVDVKGYRRWAHFLKPAGENPLLTYIIPFVLYALLGYQFLPEVLTEGFPGVIKSVVFSLFVLWLAARLTRLNIRLHL